MEGHETDKEAETKDGRVNTLSQKVFPIQEENGKCVRELHV